MVLKHSFFLVVGLFLLTTLPACAQHGGAAKSQLTWYTNLGEAQKVSNAKKKPIFAFFTGSDWCGWCTKLHNDVLNKPAFIEWAKKNVVLLELDFPRRKQLSPELAQQNNELQQTFKIQGYPTVWFVSAAKTAEAKINLNALGSSGYVAGGPKVWIDGANQIIQKK